MQMFRAVPAPQSVNVVYHMRESRQAIKCRGIGHNPKAQAAPGLELSTFSPRHEETTQDPHLCFVRKLITHYCSGAERFDVVAHIDRYLCIRYVDAMWRASKDRSWWRKTLH